MYLYFKSYRFFTVCIIAEILISSKVQEFLLFVTDSSMYRDHSLTKFVNLTGASENITLTCTSFLPTRWLFNGEPVPMDDTVSYNLELSNIAIQDAGIYQCFVSNSSASPLTSYRILPYGMNNWS